MGLAIARGCSERRISWSFIVEKDKAIHVGDFVKDRAARLNREDIAISFRGARTSIRTFRIPTGSLAQMQFENMARRNKLLVNQTFFVGELKPAEQLRFVLDRAGCWFSIPRSNRVVAEFGKMSFGRRCLSMELLAYGKTAIGRNSPQFGRMGILKTAEIVEASGTSLRHRRSWHTCPETKASM